MIGYMLVAWPLCCLALLWLQWDAVKRIAKLMGRVQWLEECERVRARRELVTAHPEVLEYEAELARLMQNVPYHERLKMEVLAAGGKVKES